MRIPACERKIKRQQLAEIIVLYLKRPYLEKQRDPRAASRSKEDCLLSAAVGFMAWLHHTRVPCIPEQLELSNTPLAQLIFSSYPTEPQRHDLRATALTLRHQVSLASSADDNPPWVQFCAPLPFRPSSRDRSCSCVHRIFSVFATSSSSPVLARRICKSNVGLTHAREA
jgi:hypothetical protein